MYSHLNAKFARSNQTFSMHQRIGMKYLYLMLLQQLFKSLHHRLLHGAAALPPDIGKYHHFLTIRPQLGDIICIDSLR